MFWLLQNRFLKDSDQAYTRLYENLNRLGIRNTLCSVIPFSEDGIESDIDLNQITDPIFAFGSHTLSKICIRRGYNPGAFISENKAMNKLLENYKEEMLNFDMTIGKLSEVETDLKEFFIRPARDTKAFVAEVVTKSDFEEFRSRIIESHKIDHFSTVRPDTLVVISSPKRIEQECRFFIVDKKIVTYSQYKVGENIRYCPVVDSFIIEYVEKMISIWDPEIAYCLDIAVSNGQPKVLEINSINSSGLYALDTQKFIVAIEQLTERYL